MDNINIFAESYDSYVRDKLMSRYGFGPGKFIFEVNFEQHEHRKHPYFHTLNCSRVTIVSFPKADSHITN